MNNMFKRVAKLLDGSPLNGYSETYKPIRASAQCRDKKKGTRKEVPSEFELHNQVIHNTWGRIEFEIEPLTENLEPNIPKQTELDYRVKVKTKYRLPTATQEFRMAQEKFLKERQFKEKPAIVKDPSKSLNESTGGRKGGFQILDRVTEIFEKKETVDKNDTSPYLEQIKEDVSAYREKIQQESQPTLEEWPSAKEFHCRESQRMLTLIAHRKANAEILREKSVFANFSLPVLTTLAKSPQTPKNALRWLAFHENVVIRKAVAMNKNTDADILEILARDEEESIRLAVAENPVVNKEFLLKLLNDDMVTVVKKAKNILDDMTRSQANQNNVAALEALSELVDKNETNNRKNTGDEDGDFLWIVASRPTTPPRRLAQLAMHDDWNIRMAVAGNPSATVHTLALLAEDPVSLVRNKVRANSNCPPDAFLHAKA